MPDDLRTKKHPEQPASEAGGKDKPLRARPVAGEVDHEALSREFIVRFPKLRAALAK